MKKILAEIVFAISALGFLWGLKCEIIRLVYGSGKSSLFLIGISLFLMILSICVIFMRKKD